MKSYNFIIYKDGEKWKSGHCVESWKRKYEEFEKMGLFREGCYINFQDPDLLEEQNGDN